MGGLKNRHLSPTHPCPAEQSCLVAHRLPSHTISHLLAELQRCPIVQLSNPSAFLTQGKPGGGRIHWHTRPSHSCPFAQSACAMQREPMGTTTHLLIEHLAPSPQSAVAACAWLGLGLGLGLGLSVCRDYVRVVEDRVSENDHGEHACHRWP